MDASGLTVEALAKRHTFSHVYPSDSVLKVWELLANDHNHRVAVLDPSSNLVIHIISQSAVIDLLHQKADEFKEELNRTVEDVKLGTRPVLSVPDTTPALVAFQLMDSKKLSGIAITNSETGRLIESTSGVDLKLFVRRQQRNRLQLDQPIMDFLAFMRQAESSRKTHVPAVSISKKSTIAKLLGRFHATHSHRVFVSDDNDGHKPDAIISVSDIIRFCLQYQS